MILTVMSTENNHISGKNLSGYKRNKDLPFKMKNLKLKKYIK